jgi:serine/threonine protein kinase
VLYKARDLKLHRIVALKFLRVVEGGQASALGEARALASLSHENVVPVFDVGVGRVTLPDEKPGSGQPPDQQLPPERIFIVMELVHGLTLREWVEDKSRPEILKAFVQAARALVAAHTAGLVHRDFKPENRRAIPTAPTGARTAQPARPNTWRPSNGSSGRSRPPPISTASACPLPRR